jgi:hypothetical protein
MPYEEHPVFIDPKGKDLKLWRYMDFTKFISLIKSNSLFFPTTRILTKIDPWEGSWLKKELEHRLNWFYKFELGKQGECKKSTIEGHQKCGKMEIIIN